MDAVLAVILKLAALGLAAIVLYDVFTHPDLSVSLLKNSGQFITTETSVLEAK